MRKDNCIYAKVTLDWANITLPLVAGTPLSEAGVVANSSSAFGIVPVALKKRLPAGIDAIDVIVGGDVDLDSLEYATLSEAAIKAMNGIRFYDDNTFENPFGVPDAAVDKKGVVLQAGYVEDSEAETVAALVEDFNGLLEALRDAGILQEEAPA